MRRSAVVLLASAIVAMLLLSGCQKAVSELTSAWPEARSERTVPAPAAKTRWPFTGGDTTPEKASRRPISVKIENSSAARPQTGLNSADVVYETIAEGGITRFNCIYHSKIPKVVGPVRSARLSDQWIVPQYDGLFFYSGRSRSVGAALAKRNLADLSHDRAPSAYYRISSRSAPHNLMLDTSKTSDVARNRDYRTTSKAKRLQFKRRSEQTTPAITSINIPFSQTNRVEWRYDEDSNVYRRWNNGSEHRDAATGKQVTAHNVVVMWAPYTRATQDKVGSLTWNIGMGGEGRMTLFSEGQRYNGTWTADRTSPPQFADEDGKPIKLTPGRTWFQVIPLDGTVTMK